MRNKELDIYEEFGIQSNYNEGDETEYSTSMSSLHGSSSKLRDLPGNDLNGSVSEVFRRSRRPAYVPAYKDILQVHEKHK